MSFERLRRRVHVEIERASAATSREGRAMKDNSWIRLALRLLLFLSLALIGCNLTRVTDSSPPFSSKSVKEYDLSGVWTGSSITSCTPLRTAGPWRCGAKTYIKLTFITQMATITGMYASLHDSSGNAFEQTGRIVEMPRPSATTLWLRVIMQDHSSCLFSSNMLGEEMEGSYFCLHNATSAERGRWMVKRSY